MGQAARIGLKPGDLIVEVDGVKPDKDSMLAAIRSFSTSPGSVKVRRRCNNRNDCGGELGTEVDERQLPTNSCLAESENGEDQFRSPENDGGGSRTGDEQRLANDHLVHPEEDEDDCEQWLEEQLEDLSWLDNDMLQGLHTAHSEVALDNALQQLAEDARDEEVHMQGGPQRLTSRRFTKGQSASAERINSLPTSHISGPVQGATDDEQDASPDARCLQACTICLGEFDAGECVKTLPCAHLYHASCIDRWLSLKDACPMCKAHI
jgi:hypothetical protein